MTDAIGHDRGRTGEEKASRLFDALADERRRVVLDCLAGADAPMAVEDLARQVAARRRWGEEPAGRSDPPADAVHRVHVSLHHAHLPKLDDAGLVEYDPDEQVVRAAADPSELPGL